VIILSARGQEREKIALLDAGADDYVTKPFSANELMARIRVVLRHSLPEWKEDEVIAIGDLSVDFGRRRVSLRQSEVHLTPLEFKMLTLLMRNPGKVLTHRYIQQEVWGYETDDDYQTLRVFMANIRRKIEADTSKPRYIITEMGVGYRFADE
jgi:two-component system KDP operon response regulator KdpE